VLSNILDEHDLIILGPLGLGRSLRWGWSLRSLQQAAVMDLHEMIVSGNGLGMCDQL